MKISQEAEHSFNFKLDTNLFLVAALTLHFKNMGIRPKYEIGAHQLKHPLIKKQLLKGMKRTHGHRLLKIQPLPIDVCTEG